MVEEKYRHLYPYTMNCIGGNLFQFQKIIDSEKFRDFFKGDFSEQKVRDYFMTIHNEETLNHASMNGLPDSLKFLHLAIPYEIKKSEKGVFYAEVSKPFYKLPKNLESRTFDNQEIKLIRNLGILETQPKPNDILISHGIYIADNCKKQKLEKYDYLYSEKEQAA